jgi:hypothetical protein
MRLSLARRHWTILPTTTTLPAHRHLFSLLHDNTAAHSTLLRGGGGSIPELREQNKRRNIKHPKLPEEEEEERKNTHKSKMAARRIIDLSVCLSVGLSV